jgi:hypothetical protein
VSDRAKEQITETLRAFAGNGLVERGQERT